MQLTLDSCENGAFYGFKVFISKTSRKQVSVKWVVGRDSNFSGLVFGLLTFSGESAAEYAAISGF